MNEQIKIKIQDSCGTCRFFVPETNDDKGGRCRRFPRQRSTMVLIDPAGAQRVVEDCNYPLHLTTDWCGEFVEGDMITQGNG